MNFPMSASRPALFLGEVLTRLLRQRHENPAFLEHSERSPLRISAHGVEHDVHIANVIFKARRLVVDRFIAAEFSDQLDVFGAGSGADNSCAVRTSSRSVSATSSGANGSDAATAPGASVPSSGPSGTPRALYIQKSRSALSIVFAAGPGPSLALTPQQCGP
jgi:hypothetical protein